MSPSLFMKIMSSSIAIANKAGNIIRDVMNRGALGVIDKVKSENQLSYFNFIL